MNREDIIRMVREASSGNDDRNIFFDLIIEELERFAALVASAEREACAKLCDGWTHADGDQCAEAIRARGDKHD